MQPVYLIALSLVITISSVLTWSVGGASPWIGVAVTLFCHGVLAVGVFHPRSSLLCPTYFGWEDPLRAVDRPPIALTFDDGPDPTNTPRVLDMLESDGVRATFFLIGRHVLRHPDLARRIVAEGHEVANHSHQHPRHIYLWSADRVAEDSEQAQSAIHDATGATPTIYRPPVGFRSLGMAAAMRRIGLSLVNFTVRAGDTGAGSAPRITQRVLSSAAPGGIILMHDGSDREESPDRTAMLEALPRIISGLRDAGYRFVTVSELMAERTPAPSATNSVP